MKNCINIKASIPLKSATTVPGQIITPPSIFNKITCKTEKKFFFVDFKMNKSPYKENTFLGFVEKTKSKALHEDQ